MTGESEAERRAEWLLGRWLHSHEEDSDEVMVFRPADFEFPPSRGRSGFGLAPGGELVDVSIAAQDGTRESRGSWKLVGKRLELYAPAGATPERAFEIERVEEDRLLLRRPR